MWEPPADLLRQVNLIVTLRVPTLMHRLQEEIKRTEAADAAKGVLRSGQHLHRVQELTLELAGEYLEALAKDLTELLERFERPDEGTGSWLKSRLQEAHEGLLKSQTEAMKNRAKRMGLPPGSIDASVMKFGHRMASIASRIGTSVDIAVNRAALESSRSQHKAESKTSIHASQAETIDSGQSLELEQKFRILFSPNQLQQDLANEALSQPPMSLLYLDIDGFKRLNTRFTETTVDRFLLPEFQRMIQSVSRSRGRVYRQGGEEFCILLPNHTLVEAQEFAERARAEIESATFKVDEQAVRLTVSIGVGTRDNSQGDAVVVVQEANSEERAAKASGGNCVRPALKANVSALAATPVQQGPTTHTTALEEKLRLEHFRDGIVRCPHDQVPLKVWETTGFGYESPGLSMHCPVCIFKIEIPGIPVHRP